MPYNQITAYGRRPAESEAHHAVDVIAFCDNLVDHVVTAPLTAAVMNVIGGSPMSSRGRIKCRS
ncbi:DUF6368 family protein [Streptomyces sp. NBC_00696]|uniref:DUF6368 family protein n=1 Tax=Streptomyces sp. NBC_00696 TaxID=2903672 RepID=UPI002E3746DF|nr:DUF6368 family protein [Streptomyces sp. NBC_00696]